MKLEGASTEWQLDTRAAELYQSVLVPSILGPAAQTLVEWAQPADGERVLDVGCGTGAASRAVATAVGSNGRVVAVDINPGMLEVARSLPTDSNAVIEWREGDASDLPVADAAFDLVLSAQTLQFLPDPSGALAEMLRVTRSGGRIALSLWSAIEESPYFFALVESMTRHVGPGVAQGLKAAFRLSDERDIRDLLPETGFFDLVVTTIPMQIDLPPLRQFVPEHVGATPMGVGYRSAPLQEQDAVIRSMEEAMSEWSTAAGVRVPFTTHVVTAVRS